VTVKPVTGLRLVLTLGGRRTVGSAERSFGARATTKLLLRTNRVIPSPAAGTAGEESDAVPFEHQILYM